MKHLLTLASGLFLGLIAALLLLRAGFPPALAALIFWLVGGVIGVSLLQFAFLKKTIFESSRVIKVKPLRAFLTGVVVLEIPLLAASCFHLGGADPLAWLSVSAFFGGFVLLLWPANMAFLVGQRLAPQESLPRQVAAGSFIIATSLLVPIFGWLWLAYLATLVTGGFALRGRYA